MTPPRPPSVAALRRHHKRIQGMIDDPECIGDLFAFGVAIAMYVDFDPSFRDRKAVGRTITEIGLDALRYSREKAIFINGVQVASNGTYWKIREIIRKDIRRYDPLVEPENSGYRCKAPMIRREGVCGQSSRRSTMVTDLDTGRRFILGGCSRHLDWYERTVRRSREAVKSNPPPVPHANTGGVLARHLQEIRWEKIYVSIDPDWKAPPEENPWRKPRFSLLVGDAADPSLDAPRPVLAVVPGMGERINIDTPRSPA